MKITVKNLGVIEQAEIDLKPLTVFVGHNGTGKTWTAYALASVFSPYGFKKYLDNYLENKTKHSYAELDVIIESILTDGSAELDIVQFTKTNIENYINDVASLAPSWLRSYLATKRVNFDNLSIQIDLQNTELAKRIISMSTYSNLSLLSKELNLSKEENSTQIFFFMESKKKSKKDMPTQTIKPSQIIKRFICKEIFEILHRTFFFNIALFPTERTTFIAVPIFNHTNIEKNESEQFREYRTFSFSVPIAYLRSIMESASSISIEDRLEYVEEMPQIKDYIKLADFLEDNILQGKGSFEELGVHKELLFTTNDVKLEIGVTSSMIKELMPLVLYLRYLALPNHLIVIDEPEMNLHPAAQIEIIEFLAMLVNTGLNVLITTHSPYIVDHISNLIEAKKQHNPEEIKAHFYLEDSRAFIEQDKVSVYLFEENTAKNILAEDGSINWETFWNVSSDVSDIYAELLKNKNHSADCSMGD